MEISLQMNTGICKIVRFNQKGSYNLAISCQAKSSVALQSGKTNFYEVLSLDPSKNVCFDEIKKAYRWKALKYHPDICPDPLIKEESTRRFIEINMAYETLSDPISREIYDHEMSMEDLPGRRYGSWNMENRRAAGFSREVLERQLNGLEKRSSYRMEKRRNQCM